MNKTEELDEKIEAVKYMEKPFALVAIGEKFEFRDDWDDWKDLGFTNIPWVKRDSISYSCERDPKREDWQALGDLSKINTLCIVIDHQAVTQERRDKLEALDSNMRLVRRLDEAERARDKVFRDAAIQLAEAKERYQALQMSKDLLGMEKARLNQKYVQALGSREAYRSGFWNEANKVRQLQKKHALLAAGVAGVAWSALVYFLS